MEIVYSLIGGIIGYFVNTFAVWLGKPKVKFYFVKEKFNLGYDPTVTDNNNNYKIVLKIIGSYSPGICEFFIYWNDKIVSGKWDDNPNPIEYDSTSFNERLIPQTMTKYIILNREYKIPIFNVSGNNIITIFDGWWFGRRMETYKEENERGYGVNPIVEENQKIKIVLSGSNFKWEKEIKIEDVIEQSGNDLILNKTLSS